MSRKHSGFLWGSGILTYALSDLEKARRYYRLARQAKTILEEEYYYQRVFHSDKHSKNLVREIWIHPRARNNVSTTEDILETEHKNTEHKNTEHDNTDIVALINDVTSVCNEEERKVLAWFVVFSGCDSQISNIEDLLISNEIHIVWTCNNIQDFYGYIGTRWKYQQARKQLKKILKTFKLLETLTL